MFWHSKVSLPFLPSSFNDSYASSIEVFRLKEREIQTFVFICGDVTAQQEGKQHDTSKSVIASVLIGIQNHCRQPDDPTTRTARLVEGDIVVPKFIFFTIA